MADQQEDDLPQATTLNAADFIRIVADLAGTPVSKVISRANVTAYFDTLYEAIGGGGTGWQEISTTWTRTGNHTFTISTDVTATYTKGTKIRYKDGGSYEYGVIVSSVYGSPNTTVSLAVNSDYAMAAATITDKAISYQSNPQGFPQFFNFTTTFGGFSANPSGYIFRFRIVSNTCKISINALDTGLGTSNATTFTMTAPVTAKNTTNYYQYAPIPYATDNSATIGSAIVFIAPNSATLTLYKSATSAAWTASGTKGAAFKMDIEF